MDFSHSDDRRMLADTLARFISDRADPMARSKLADTTPGYDPAVWAGFAELGAIGALFSPDHGGFGGGGFDIMVVFEALGRGLVAAPFLSSLMAGRILAAAGRGAELEALITGEHTVAFAHDESAAGYDRATVATRAERKGDGWVLSGKKSVIRDAEGADLLVTARTSGAEDDPGGLSLFLVTSGTPGVSLDAYPCVDGGRAAEVALDAVTLPATALIGAEGVGGALISDAMAAGTLALCAEALGLMEVIRDTTIEFLRTRVQFGEPIGRNQALQHRMATVLLEIEQARSAVINAAAALDRAGPDTERVLSAAKYTIGKTGTFVAEEAIQLHGGIGMTWELAMTHFAKRLVLINHQLGDEDYHLARYIALGQAA